MPEAVRVTQLGADPLATFADHVVIEPQSPPEPGPGEVRVRVHATHVNWVDLIMASGQYQHVPDPPYTPGLEYAGVVEAVGEGVQGLREGDRVAADGTKTGPRCADARYRPYGGWATYALAPEGGLVRVPDALDFAQAATYLGAYITAYHALVVRGRVQAGEKVLVLGASGTTGLAAVHVAKAIGATVVAAGRSEAKLEVVAAQGADHCVRTEDVGALKPGVEAAVGRVHVVYDPVGGALSVPAMRCLRFGGRFVVVGWASTPFVARKGKDPNVLPTNLMIMKQIDVLGSPAVIAAQKDERLGPARLSAIHRWIEEGTIRPYVGAVHPLAEFPAACRAKWESAVAGSIALTVG